MMGRDSVEVKITDELRQNRNKFNEYNPYCLGGLSGLNLHEMKYGSERSFLRILTRSRIIAWKYDQNLLNKYAINLIIALKSGL